MTYTYAQIQARINRFIAQLEYVRPPQELYRPIEYTLAQSGKRIRPVLLLLSYNLYKEEIEEALYAAAAIETYHNYTLIHDDVMDRADMRRGKPTVSAKWGENAAILSGDTMLVLSYEFLSHAPTEKLPLLLSLFNQTAKEIGEGQQYDMEFETREEVSEEEYMEMIRLKTSVLLAASLKMGALLADAPKEDLNALYSLGETLGLAFQLQDDLLDVYGDPLLFGKKIGGDIVCNKKSYLLIKALQESSPAQQKEIKERMSQTHFDKEEKIERFTQIYNSLHLREQSEKRIEELFKESCLHLSKLSVGEEKKQELKKFMLSLLKRNI